jgi:DNA polymerase-3 subunit alpha
MQPFTHLHVHSDASIGDGLRPVATLVGAAKELGYDTLALTDHGTLANAISFAAECKIVGIKPIFGLEAYLAIDKEISHVTLLADGERGFNNLVTLNNLGHKSDFPKPAFMLDDLFANAEGIICLSGCVSSPFNKGSYNEAKLLASKFKAVFGSRLFSEIMFVADIDTWSRPLQLAQDLNLKLVITNDVHFPYQMDSTVHTVFMRMRSGYEYNSKELYLKDPSVIWQKAQGAISKEVFDDAVARAYRISQKIETVNLSRPPSLPAIENAVDELRSIIKLNELEPQYKSRAEYELNIIQESGYSTYFLILNDIIQYAKRRGVRVGPGRGSGAGSLIIYLLGITSIDPIKYNLSFERFLNPERRGMPDVDIDFDSQHRDEVLEYAMSHWHAHQIATYARYSHKILTHDLAKAFHVPRELEESAAEKGVQSDEFSKVCGNYQGFKNAYEAISGQIRHKGKHAGGVVITDMVVPIERTGEVLAAAWTEGEHNELSSAGIVKYDLLGLSALSVLNRLEHRYGRHAEEPEDNHPAFGLFRQGDLSGVFQFSGSPGIKELTLKLEPTKFEDLVAINALYRPGALDVGATQKYPEWKKEPRRMPAIIADILAPTYGAIVYQEQVMAIFSRLTGGSLGESDLARRVIVKSKVDDPAWLEQFRAIRDKFINGAASHGLNEIDAEDLWNEVAAHARYSFNKSHAVAYSMIAWEMAWWKWFNKAAFYCELLNVDAAEAQTYIFEAVRSGVQLKMPLVNSPSLEYQSDDNSIIMPLTSIKYLSTPGANAIIGAHPFKSIEDFMARVPKRIVRGRAREGLYHLGAFEGIEGNPHALAIKSEVIDLARYKTQREYFGLVVPSQKLLELIEKEKEKGHLAGVIAERKSKCSNYGPYIVYYLLPDGIFWRRGEAEFEVGDIVIATTNKKTGKVITARKVL